MGWGGGGVGWGGSEVGWGGVEITTDKAEMIQSWPWKSFSKENLFLFMNTTTKMLKCGRTSRVLVLSNTVF